MYSRFGKFLPYQFHILLSKDQILSKPTEKETRYFNKPSSVKEENNKGSNSHSTDDKSSKTRKKKKRYFYEPASRKELNHKVFNNSSESVKPSFIFKSQSRDEFYKAIPKTEAPPVGHYNCNYNYLEKSPKSAVFKRRKKTKSRKLIVPNTPIPFSSYVPKQKVNSISFEKQVPRDNIFVHPLNENRFLSFQNMPAVCSNFRRTSTPNISKTSGRCSILSEPKYLNSYNADYKLVKEDLGKVHQFEKVSGRKPLFDEKIDMREYEINWKSIEKKSVVADFSTSCSKLKFEEVSNEAG